MTIAQGQTAAKAKPTALTVQAKLAIVVVAALAAGALFWPRGDGTHKAPGGFLYDPDGRPATLGERLAPVTLLHFWATWCPPCLDELPSLARLGADVASDEFAILMVAVDDEAERAASFLGSRAASALYDPSWEVAHRYGTYKLPETYLLVGNRVVEVVDNEDRFVGAQNWDDPRIRRRLEETIRRHRPPGIRFSPPASQSR
jgi:thiol-disulfide isomerase/thioredoxin